MNNNFAHSDMFPAQKRQNNKKGSKTVIKTEKNNKSRPKKNSKSENKK